MTGEADFNEVFFENVRVPKDSIVGERGQGWYVSRSTLKHERALIGNATFARRTFDGVVMMAQAIEIRGRRAIDDPVFRDRLADLEARLLAAEYNGYRLLTASARGQEPGLAGLVPKLHSTTLATTSSKLAMDLMSDRGCLFPGETNAPAMGMFGTRLHVVLRHGDRRRRSEHPAQRHRGARPRPAARRSGSRRRWTSASPKSRRCSRTPSAATLETECPTTRVRTIMESATGHDPALWRGLAELGVPGLAGPRRARRQRARAARRRARRRGARLGLRAGAVPRLSDGDRRPPRERRRRRAGALAARASRRASAIVTFALGEGLGEWDAAKLGATRHAAGGSRARSRSSPTPTSPTRSSSRRATTRGRGSGSSSAAPSGLEHDRAQGLRHDPAREHGRASRTRRPTKIASGRAAIDRARDAGLVLLAADAFGGAAQAAST